MKITVRKNGQKKAPWRQRVSLRWALVLTTVLCALGAFLLIALESWGLEWARDALYLKYITPYYADESETGEYYSVSPDGTVLYVEATMPYAYVDPSPWLEKEKSPFPRISPVSRRWAHREEKGTVLFWGFTSSRRCKEFMLST